MLERGQDPRHCGPDSKAVGCTNRASRPPARPSASHSVPSAHELPSDYGNFELGLDFHNRASPDREMSEEP